MSWSESMWEAIGTQHSCETGLDLHIYPKAKTPSLLSSCLILSQSDSTVPHAMEPN